MPDLGRKISRGLEFLEIANRSFFSANFLAHSSFHFSFFLNFSFDIDDDDDDNDNGDDDV